MVHLKWKDAHHTTGNAEHQSRLASLLHFCLKWFSKIGLLLFLTLNIAGYYFFSKYNRGVAVQWRLPWLIMCFTTSSFLVVDSLLAFTEGLGKVKEVARMRLVQQSVYIVFVIIFLSSGFKLYSSALAAFIAFISVTAMFSLSQNARLLYNIWGLKGNWTVNYRKEIFPYQWKIAISWMSGYFIFQLFNPILFATEGAVAAGQMGMTLAALNGVLGLSMSWINTKIPLFSGLVAKKDFSALDDTFFKSFRQSLSITVLGLIVLFSIITMLQHSDFTLGKRFLPTLPLAFLCFSYLMNNIAFALATYLRCHKQEPLLLQSVVFAVLSALSTIIFGNLYGVLGITCGYFLLGVIVGMPWVVNIFLIKRKLWH